MLIVALIILQLLIFTALIFIFRKVINQNVVVATQHLDELGRDYNDKQKKIDMQLEEAKVKAQEIVALAQQEAEKQKAEIIQSTQKEKDRLLTDARSRAEEIIQQAEKSRYQLLVDLDNRIEKESVQRAIGFIGQVLPESFRRQVHDRWTEDLLKESLGQLKQAHLPPDAHQVKIISAFPLDEEQRQSLFKKIKSELGKDIEFKEEVDSKIVAGFIVCVGSLMIDGSLKNKIEEQAKNAQNASHE